MLLKNCSIKDINRVLKTILVLVVRNFYFLSEKTNDIVKPFANLSKKLYNGEISIDTLLNNIYSYAETDDLVKRAIINKDYIKRKAVRALLIIMYNNGSEELKINNGKVDLEHILPQKPKEGGVWDNTFSKEHNKYVNKLGNLTLWYTEDNRCASNAEFANKVDKYKTSQLEENIKISKKDKWTKKEINQRTKNMADEILKIFRINN